MSRYWGSQHPTGSAGPVQHISPAEIKIKHSKLPSLGRTLWPSSRQRASFFREVVKEETKSSPGSRDSPLCRPLLTGRAPSQEGQGRGTQCQFCETRTCPVRYKTGNRNLSVLSHGELDPVPEPGESPVLMLCGVAAFTLGSEHCVCGLPRTDGTSAGTKGGHAVSFAFGGHLL